MVEFVAHRVVAIIAKVIARHAIAIVANVIVCRVVIVDISVASRHAAAS